MNPVRTQLELDKAPPDLINLVVAILVTCNDLAERVSLGALGEILGATESENVQGEVQKKLDVVANNLLVEALKAQGSVRTLASEEEDTVVGCTVGAPYIVAFDPLDGSSNIDINGQIGTIFTIFSARDDVPYDSEEQFFQTGNDQLCGGYVLYGPYTTLVISTGIAAHEFTLDKNTGEFISTRANFIFHNGTREFAANMANLFYWSKHFQNYLLGLIAPTAKSERFNMRWQGAMVGDVHRILTRGGVFIYPNDSRDANQPAKLRLLYEAFPMALLVTAAGGLAYTETNAILDTRLTLLHQRTPVILGDSNLVTDCVTVLSS